MNPNYRVIFSMVSSAAGYGLLALLGLVGNAHGRASTPEFAYVGIGVALVLIMAGLFSPMRHPAEAQNSPWMSYERLGALAACAIALAYGAVWSGFLNFPQWIGPLGLLTALIAMGSVFCTGMIYYRLETIPAWSNRFTIPTALLLSLAMGSGLLNTIAFAFGRFQTPAGRFMALLTLILTLSAIILKWLYWRWLRRKAIGQQPPPRLLQMLCMLMFDVAFFSCLPAPEFNWLVFPCAVSLLAAAFVERRLFLIQA